jgi:hypothetical protein
LLFLGAGASKAVGLGDLGDLTSKVKSELKKKRYGNIYENRMIIINSDKRIKEQAYKIFPKNKIDFIKAQFGDKTLSSKIKDFLR